MDQACPECGRESFLRMSDEPGDLWWSCSTCGYEVGEDDGKSPACVRCGDAGAVWLSDPRGGFPWCFRCGGRANEGQGRT